jgi:hypothetical protein
MAFNLKRLHTLILGSVRFLNDMRECAGNAIPASGAKRASTSSAPGGSMAQPWFDVAKELATDEAESLVVRHNNFFSDRLLGLQEGIYVLLMTRYGVPAPAALGVALLIRVQMVFFSLVGGLLSLKRAPLQIEEQSL